MKPGPFLSSPALGLGMRLGMARPKVTLFLTLLWCDCGRIDRYTNFSNHVKLLIGCACSYTHVYTSILASHTHTCSHMHNTHAPHKHARTHARTRTHTHNSYIPQMEQHEPEERMLFHLGNVTDLLDVTPSNSISHPLSPPPILLHVI